jgi:acetate kinase
MAAIDRGQCVDTSMGLTPLEGLIMGTRSGDIDPAILPILAKLEQMSMADLETMLNKKSGLQGICDANDMREILARARDGDDQAELAIEMFSYRIKKYIGAYLAVLGGADAIVFTAGIGENAPQIRQRSCANLTRLGLTIDPQKNASDDRGIREIQTDDSAIRVLVVPTDEELEIAKQTLQCIGG